MGLQEVVDNMNIENLCPVCGYEMDDPPRDYNICPSCGTEFGLHDSNSAIVELRAAWIGTGPKWWSTSDPAPENWNPLEQLNRVLFGPVTTVGTTAVFIGASGSVLQFTAAASAKFPESVGIQHAEVLSYKIAHPGQSQTSTIPLPSLETPSG